MKKRYIFLFYCMLTSFVCIAQREITGSKFKDRLYYGGNVGVSFSSNYIYAQISPRIGYMVNSNFSVGTGATYIYINNKINGGSTNVYGGNLFARHNILKNFFAQAEFELLNTRFSIYDITSQQEVSRRGWVPGLFIGGGVFQSLGSRAGVSIAGFYNLLYDKKKSPYNSPFVIRAGINF